MSATKSAKTSALLLWGEDAFLLREAALEAFGDVRPAEIEASAWRGGELQQLATPSLFGEGRGLLITDARSLSKEATAELAAYLRAPDPASLLVVCAQVAERGKVPVALEKLVKPVGQVRHVQVARKELEPWLLQRARGRPIDFSPPAARALVDTVGPDPASLVAAMHQLADAFPGQRVTPQLVARQFRGLGEQKTWDLCDRAFGRDLPGAMRSLRALEEARDDPLMVLGGIAARLRDLVRVRALPDRMSHAELARAAGLRFDWQARRYQRQAGRFTMDELVALHRRVAEADRALKSGAGGDVVMPMLIAAIAGGTAT